MTGFRHVFVQQWPPMSTRNEPALDVLASGITGSEIGNCLFGGVCHLELAPSLEGQVPADAASGSRVLAPIQF